MGGKKKGKKKSSAVAGKEPDDEKSEEDNDDDDDEEEDEDPYFSKSEDEGGYQRMSMYARHTRYVAVKEIGKNTLEWHLTKKKKREWDVAWFDAPIEVALIKELKPF